MKTMWSAGETIGSKRACYDPIYNLAVGQEGAEGAFVIGSPGVGKSCFLDYALYRLQEESNSVLYLSVPRDLLKG
jgi:hypothetical protein